jgi:hypothetical protein
VIVPDVIPPLNSGIHPCGSQWLVSRTCRVCIDRLCAHLNYNARKKKMINVYLLSIFGICIMCYLWWPLQWNMNGLSPPRRWIPVRDRESWGRWWLLEPQWSSGVADYICLCAGVSCTPCLWLGVVFWLFGVIVSEYLYLWFRRLSFCTVIFSYTLCFSKALLCMISTTPMFGMY